MLCRYSPGHEWPSVTPTLSIKHLRGFVGVIVDLESQIDGHTGLVFWHRSQDEHHEHLDLIPGEPLASVRLEYVFHHFFSSVTFNRRHGLNRQYVPDR